MEIIKKTNIDFLGLRKGAFALSTLLCALGIACVVMIAMGKANLGIDFSGGASVNLLMAKSVPTEDIRAALAKNGFKDAEIQSLVGETTISLLLVNPQGMDIEALEKKIETTLTEAGYKDTTKVEPPAEQGDGIRVWILDTASTPVEKVKAGIESSVKALGGENKELTEFDNANKVLVRIKKTDVPTDQVVDKIAAAFTTAFPDDKVTVDSSSAIGPTVGKALQKDALLALSIAMLCIIIYIAWRFEFKFGLAATIATFHDVLAVLGVFFVLHKEITLLIVTALLTIAGYSLTDTVVVFDRIRENLKLRQKDNLIDIINSSINEVLSRTVVTSLTTFLTVFALFLIGGEVLHGFAFAMMAGIIVGTYSSIFVASPLLYVWRGSKGGKLIKVAMLTKQPERAGVPKPVTLAAPASSPPVSKESPREEPAPRDEQPEAKAQAQAKSKGRGKKAYKKKGRK
jgi:preprotein translocase subunit SecF